MTWTNLSVCGVLVGGWVKVCCTLARGVEESMESTAGSKRQAVPDDDALLRPVKKSRSGPSGKRKPLTEEQKAERKAKVEEGRRERKLHEAWRMRMAKTVTEGHGGKVYANRDQYNEDKYKERVMALRKVCSENANIKSCAMRTTSDGDHRLCEILVVLHKKKSKLHMLHDISCVVSARNGQIQKLTVWEPAVSKEWKQLGEGFMVLRDETPPSKLDAKLLLEILPGAAETHKAKRKPSERPKMQELAYHPRPSARRASGQYSGH